MEVAVIGTALGTAKIVGHGFLTRVIYNVYDCMKDAVEHSILTKELEDV